MVPIRSVVLGSREQVMAGPAGACRCRRYDNVLSRRLGGAVTGLVSI